MSARNILHVLPILQNYVTSYFLVIPIPRTPIPPRKKKHKIRWLVLLTVEKISQLVWQKWGVSYKLSTR